MNVGIYSFFDPNGVEQPSTAEYCRILQANGIPTSVYHRLDSSLWNAMPNMTAFIMRYCQYDAELQIARDVLPVAHGIIPGRVFPNHETSWHYDDKAKQALYFAAHGLPFIQSVVFYDRAQALEWAKTASYPQVFKLRSGAGSVNVMRVDSCESATLIIDIMFSTGLSGDALSLQGSIRYRGGFLHRLKKYGGRLRRLLRGLHPSPVWSVHKGYVMFQRFVPGNTYDTRVTTIGNRAFAFRRLVREGDWRASGSGRLDYTPGSINPACVRLSLDISKRLGFQSMAYDYLMDEDGAPVFCEASYTFISSAVEKCPVYWNDAMATVQNQASPEFYQLQDLLGADVIRSAPSRP